MPGNDGQIGHVGHCAKIVASAFTNSKEAIELVLEVEAEQGADPVPPNARVSHMIVGEIEAELPESLTESEEGAAQTGG